MNRARFGWPPLWQLRVVFSQWPPLHRGMIIHVKRKHSARQTAQVQAAGLSLGADRVGISSAAGRLSLDASGSEDGWPQRATECRLHGRHRHEAEPKTALYGYNACRRLS